MTIRRKSKNNNQDLSIIEYPHLTSLNLSAVHDDYVEPLLVDTEMCLPNNFDLSVEYEALKMVAENFTRNTMRIDSAKLSCLCLIGEYKLTTYFKDYLPQTNIF
jgi:hypothetical protein